MTTIHMTTKENYPSNSKISTSCCLRIDDWYWLESKKHCELYVYCGTVIATTGSKSSTRNTRDTCAGSSNSTRTKYDDSIEYQFRHVASGSMKSVTMKRHHTEFHHLKVRRYIPVAEAISRAQKVLMMVELEYGKKFSYNALMEFHHLRVPLQRLLVVGQMACEALDNARLNILSEVQRIGDRSHVKSSISTTGETGSGTHHPYSIHNIEPQNIIVVGGGPGGMMVCLHCTENCLASGGVMKLYEARDSFAKGGSTYERAQIVRLDARWIATMRYHLGTGFEDVFIPASGETDAQLGNTLYVVFFSMYSHMYIYKRRPLFFGEGRCNETDRRIVYLSF
jgi:hypothetical protein